MLPASAYPVQIVQAQRWLDEDEALVAKNDYSGIDNQNWDPAVKALARFPDVINMMSADLDWTTDLGDAEVNQRQDVAEVIQDLRAKAEAVGTLKTTDQQTVERVEASAPPVAGASQGSTAPQATASYISIQPTDPSTVYAPTYDPSAVYQPYSGIAPLLGFGAGIAVGALWNNNYWNWGTGAILPVLAGYSGWRGNVNNGNVGNNVKPWRPNRGLSARHGQQAGNRRRPTWEAWRRRRSGPSWRRREVPEVSAVQTGQASAGLEGPVASAGASVVRARPGGQVGPAAQAGPGGPWGVGGPGRPGGGQAASRPAGRPGGGARPAARPASRPAGRPNIAWPGREARPWAV